MDESRTTAKRISATGRAVLAALVAMGSVFIVTPSKAQGCPRPPDEILFSPDPNAINEWCSSSFSPGVLCGPVGAAPFMLAPGLVTARFLSERWHIRRR
ncbi:MAG: hypothetical protein DCC65_17720 [Planctomycetota bacterium]|nr:MAG: hypothetical protein DCC65_17720 [Planctomycetota bacterium]